MTAYKGESGAPCHSRCSMHTPLSTLGLLCRVGVL